MPLTVPEANPPSPSASSHSAALCESEDVLPAVEDGLALLLERFRAFLGVLGHRDGDADLHLLLERLRRRAPEAGEHRALDGLHRERTVAADDLRVATRLAHHVRDRDD